MAPQKTHKGHPSTYPAVRPVLGAAVCNIPDLWFWRQYWSEDGSRSVINSPESRQALEFLQELVYEKGVAPNYAESPYGEAQQLFMGKRVAMYVGAAYRIPDIIRDAPDLRFGVAPMPIAPEGRTTMVHQCIWTMSSQTEHPDAAWKLIVPLSPEILEEYWRAHGWRDQPEGL